MSELFDFSKAIQNLIKEEKFNDALKYYKDNYKSHGKEVIAKNEYIVSDIIRCLRKINKLSEARKYLTSLGLALDAKLPKRVLENYGWVLYDQLKLKESDQDQSNDEDIITGLIDESYHADNIFEKSNPLQEEILIVLPLLDYNSKYSPFSRLLSSTLKKEKKKPKPNWKFINDLLGNVDVNQLNTTCESFEANIRGRQRQIELASDMESWYAYKTKALLKLGLFQECYELSQEALNSFEKFHYNNDVWFARRIALCKKELGDTDIAIEELLAIYKKKKEWFIQSELSELYFAKNNSKEALKYGILAANNFGDVEYKIGLFLNLGSILKSMNEIEKAFEHYLLVKLIRMEQGWKVEQSLLELIRKTKNNYEKEWQSSNELLSHLKEYWKSELPKEEFQIASDKTKNLFGEIKIINIEKGFGFIRGKNNQDYYFKIFQLKSDVNQFKNGDHVVFDAFPPKEEGKKPSAVNIRLRN